MARAYLKAGLLACALTLSAWPAGAEYPVIDATAIEKATQQLNKLQEQLQVAQKSFETMQAQLNAIGKVGQLSVKLRELNALKRQLRLTSLGLTPDLQSLMPDVDFKDMKFGNVQQADQAYRQTLWYNPDDKSSSVPKSERLEQIEQRRSNVAVDAVSKAFAQADLALEGAGKLGEAAADLEQAADAAKDQNSRLAVIAQGQVLTVVGIAQQNQLLAQLLRLQAVQLLGQKAPLGTRLMDGAEAAEEEGEE